MVGAGCIAIGLLVAWCSASVRSLLLLNHGCVQTNERLIECLLCWTTWHRTFTERKQRTNRRRSVCYNIANKDGGRRVFHNTNRTLYRLLHGRQGTYWEILVTRDRSLSSGCSVSGPFVVANRKQNVYWSERSPCCKHCTLLSVNARYRVLRHIYLAISWNSP